MSLTLVSNRQTESIKDTNDDNPCCCSKEFDLDTCGAEDKRYQSEDDKIKDTGDQFYQ